MSKIAPICRHCLYWLPSDRSTDEIGYCVKRDDYKRDECTCDRWAVKSALLVKKEGSDD